MKKRLLLKEKKKISKDCWNLDLAFIKWLKPRLECYLKEGGKVIDLEHYAFEYKDNIMSQKEIIERMLEILDSYNEYEPFYFHEEGKESYALMAELLELWALVFPVMWW